MMLSSSFSVLECTWLLSTPAFGAKKWRARLAVVRSHPSEQKWIDVWRSRAVVDHFNLATRSANLVLVPDTTVKEIAS
jgi:hypothetical protein